MSHNDERGRFFSEIQPQLCSMRVTPCITDHHCQSVDIKLETKEGRYIAASPAYYEMTFQRE
jgi:hypothetical protein